MPYENRLFVTPVLPFLESGEIDEPGYRAFLRHFLSHVDDGIALIANPEAGELFTLDRDERRQVVQAVLAETAGRAPVLAGVVDVTTAGAVRTARDAAELGVDGLFVFPPIGAGDITQSWDAEAYLEVLVDLLQAITAAVDLPIVVHPVAVLGAVGKYFHENLANDAFDGTSSGAFNYALEPMLDHIRAWRAGDVRRATEIWHGGLARLHEYVFADFGRLHVRYKAATWLRGLIANPAMRPPMPLPRLAEVTRLADLLRACGLEVIGKEEIDSTVERLALAP